MPSTMTVVNQWLVLASFPNSRGKNILDTRYIRDEGKLAPSFGQRAGAMVWQAAEAPDGKLDFLSLDPPDREYCAGYACAYLHVARETTARLMFGSDDGLAVWFNGWEVWRKEIQRPCAPGEDRFEVRLKKGWNRLLCKVSQYAGGWALHGEIECGLPVQIAIGLPGEKVPAGPAAEIIVARGAKLTFSEDNRDVRLSIPIYNRGRNDIKGMHVTLLDDSGKSAARGTLDGGPWQIASVSLDGSARGVAAALARASVAIQAGNAKIQLVAADDLILTMARQIAERSGRQLEALRSALACFGLSPSNISDARDFLAAWAADRNIGQAAEKLRKAVVADRPDLKKSDSVGIIGHAHIDMNWLWTWPETVKSCHDSFRQVLAFMDEFPDFTFMQSQPSTYKAVEQIDPPLFERIRNRVREGRWELGGGMFTEGDTNMSGGEALARSFLIGQRYFLSRFGKTARVGWLPDNFGHVAQLPQILRLAGCEYFYFHRCQPHLGSFWWQSPDGSRVMAFANYTYNGTVGPHLAEELKKITPDAHRLLCVCGVGDHGGGPTRRDIESAHSLDATEKFPAVRFTTAEKFFDATRAEHADRPVHVGEMQYVFEGCYTTISRVKAGNRDCEAALEAAELLASIRSLGGQEYPRERLDRAWEIVTFNQFHDILCGSAIHESNADSAADYKWALNSAAEVRDQAMRKLADEVKFPAGLGQPIVVFNPAGHARKALVEAELFSHQPPPDAELSGWGNFYGGGNVMTKTGRPATVLLRDSAGQVLPAQIVWGKIFPPGWRWRVNFVADLPACGYRTFYVDPAMSGDNQEMANKAGVFETDFFTVAFDMKDGTIRRLFDKRTKTDLVARAGRLNSLRVYLEEPHGMSAWNIGPTPDVQDVRDVVSVRLAECGPVRACVEAVKRWSKSKFIQRTYIYKSYPRIDFELEAHWFEQGDSTKAGPMLRAIFPLSIKKPAFTSHTPFAAVERANSGQEVPAQRWVDVSGAKAGVALLNRTKYGHSLDGSELRLTLLRSSYDPDIYPDQGLHRISYALFPHAGGWKDAGVWQEGDAFNVPPLATEPPSLALGQAHATRPQEHSFISLDGRGVILSAVKRAEDGDELVVRLAEIHGRQAEARLTLPAPAAAARRLDLLERPLQDAEAPTHIGREIAVSLKPHEIVTLGIKMKGF
ncbi:MAG: alpha-mannosidase [Planctomycetes bacterium]|nr:alpha-mannosidase [Planctomycetota bacterium]